MTTDSLAEAPDAGGSRRLASLRLRLALAVPLLTGGVVLIFEWSLGGADPIRESLARMAWLVLLLSVALLLLIEALLLRPLRRLAEGGEAMAAAPATAPLEDVTGLGGELGRVGRALAQVSGLWRQQESEARELRRELAQQRQLLQQAHVALEANQRELASLARVDPLTGIANRLVFEESLRREFKRAQRLRGLLAVAVLDLDQFKQFNLAHGAAAGDAALKRVAGLLSDRFKRDTDLVARLGGEEFVALLPGFGMAEAQGVLETLREDLRALRLPDGQGDLTLSIGLAAASPAHPYLSAQALLQAADEALYIAKHTGRDRLSLAA